MKKTFSNQSWRQKKSPRHLKNLAKNLAFAVVIVFLLGWIMLAIFTAWAARDLPDPNKLISRNIVENTKFYDRTGAHLLSEVSSNKKRTLIDLKDIPDFAKWATIVIEDKNFYSHKGVAWQSIIRAFVSNLLAFKTGAGGASTLTQQLVKNAILSNEHSYTRKLKEAILAMRIEQKYTKDEILKMYFNEIPYGSTNYGIEAASESYFGKKAVDLSVAEAATLAAMVQAPSRYLNHLDVLHGRRDFVIDKLLESNHITPAQADEAKKQLLKISRFSPDQAAPHFVNYVTEILTDKYGEKTVAEGGLKVITTLDFDLQKIAEEEVKKGAASNAKKYKANNAALVALDPKTGQVLAMVGSKDYYDEKIDGQVNVATSLRQPGSSFKPIAYAAGFEKGLTPDTKVYDVETTFKTDFRDYTPHDYDGKERGPVTLRKALAGSLNIPAVKVLYLTGIDRVLDLADKMGYTTFADRSRFGLSLVLGGAEVKLLEHTHGFSVLANQGQMIPSSAILKVSDNQGTALEEWSEPQATPVLDSEAAREVVSIMTDNDARSYIFGAKSPLILPDRVVAAKTGTTNDEKGNWKDGWTLGFTPSLAAGVWAGNTRGEPMAKNADGVFVAAPIWRNFMIRALKDKPVETFTPPDPYPANTRPILLGQGLGAVTLNINKLNGLIALPATPPDLIEQRTFLQPHEILYYVNKDDLNGPPPTDPAQDPQFAGWEAGVQKWAAKTGIVFEPLPTQTDNSQADPSLPALTITTPTANQTVSDRSFEITAASSNDAAFAKMSFYVDDQLLDTKTSPPFSIRPTLYETTRGFHTIKVIGYSPSGGYTLASLDINFTAPDPAPNSSWLFPASPRLDGGQAAGGPGDGTELDAARFPMALRLQLYQLNQIKTITVALTNASDGSKNTLSAFTDPTDKTLIVPWDQAPKPGDYTLSVAIIGKDGNGYQGESVSVTVK